MILSRTTKPSLGWMAGLAVFALAGVLFLTPSIGEAQSEPKPKQIDDLKQVEDALRAKLAEIEELRKKADLLAKARQDQARRQVESERKAVLLERLTSTKQAGQTIRIEISGFSGKPEEVEKLAKTLEKALGSKESKVIILRAQQGGMPGMGMGGMMPGGDGKPVPGQQWSWEWRKPATAPVPPAPGMPGMPPGVAAPKPMQGGAHGGDVEKKLDQIMKELDAIRKELKARPAPRTGSGSGRAVPGGELPPGGGVPGGAR